MAEIRIDRQPLSMHMVKTERVRSTARSTYMGIGKAAGKSAAVVNHAQVVGVNEEDDKTVGSLLVLFVTGFACTSP